MQGRSREDTKKRALEIGNKKHKNHRVEIWAGGALLYAGRKRLKLFEISLPKRGPKPDLNPRPPDLYQNVRNFIANTLGKLQAPEGSF